MEHNFDELLAERIRNKLQNHSEAYRHGAWERFLGKRNKNKSTIIYWTVSSIAACVALLVGLAITFTATIDEQPDRNPVLTQRKVLEDSLSSGSSDPFVQKKHGVHAAENKTSDGISAPSKSNHAINLKDVDTQEKDIAIVAKTLPINVSPLMSDQRSYSMLPDLTRFIKTRDLWNTTLEDDASQIKQRNTMSAGLILSPGYGMSEEEEKASQKSGFGGGLSLDIPMKNSSFSVISGITLNTSTTKSHTSVKTVNNYPEQIHEEVNQYNITVPINLSYTIPTRKRNLALMAGLSSSFMFRENLDYSATSIREVQVFSQTNEGVAFMTTTERVTQSNSSNTSPNTFYPLGTALISIGYKKNIADNILLEFHPFYSYPLKISASDPGRIPMGGISLRLIYLRKSN